MKMLRLHLHAENDTCDVCRAEARREGEIKALLRVARHFTKPENVGTYFVRGRAVAVWCRSEAARLRKGR